ncbi:UbiA family prenyltransferase [Nocardia crassostreae]|uniref:UbiA family prenyltransferase n=1 Tax=Nocardia crassostreae TaxID=53428 RepID=UPI000B266724|nr:UbiA family prenyltransferase [Nocardia crassostreae]
MQMDIAAIDFTAGKTIWSDVIRFSKDFLQESRISVQISCLIRFCTAAVLGASMLDGQVWIAALTWVFATLAAYVFNGVMDVTEDRENGSTRPISRGSLPVPIAVGGVVGAGAPALAIAGVVDAGGLLPILVLAHLTCGYAYSGGPIYGKRRGSTAALLVLGMGVLTYAAGWAAAGQQGGLPVLVLGTAMSLWMAGVGALVKDLSDAEGDAAAGRRTPVVVWGEGRVRLLASSNAVLISGGYLCATMVFAPVLAPSAIALALGAAAVGILCATTRRAATRTGRRLPYRAFMVTQYSVHLAILATLLLAGTHLSR